MSDTIVLGLGSNKPCALSHLRKAVQALDHLPQFTITSISNVYQSAALLPDNAPAAWQQPFLNIAVKCQTQLNPQTCLAIIKNLEQSLGRQITQRWAPRLIDIDILIWDDHYYQENNLTIPHKGLLDRAFALRPLLDVWPTWRHPQYPDQSLDMFQDHTDPQDTFKTNLRIKPPHIVGILNVTPDSFSDGGHFIQSEAALDQVKAMLEAGAEIIDIGAESTRPTAANIDPQTEWQRLEPILVTINQLLTTYATPFTPKISLDTRHPATLERALQLIDIAWINDVEGKHIKQFAAMLKASKLKYVMMHNLGVPPKKQQVLGDSPLTEIHDYFVNNIRTLTQAGVTTDQIIIDPGIGFGKSIWQNRLILNNISKLKCFELPILIGHSRKSFIQSINHVAANERDIETLALTLLTQQHADYLRVHNVEWTQRALTVNDWFQQ